MAIWSKEANDSKHASISTLHTDAPADSSTSWQQRVVGSIVSLLYEYRLELGAAFKVRTPFIALAWAPPPHFFFLFTPSPPAPLPPAF